MHFTKPLALFLFQLALADPQPSGCGDADACPLTASCATLTRNMPTQTTITTCQPTQTCLTVYESCEFGGSGMSCCSGYCAATKCRATDPEYPDCREDNDLCSEDEDCCYDAKCVGGFCRR